LFFASFFILEWLDDHNFEVHGELFGVCFFWKISDVVRGSFCGWMKEKPETG
jgi:hypothetical protein